MYYTNIPKGQLSGIERKYLYDTIRIIKPKIALESGTWYGGGSTLQITRSLFDNNYGKLYTYEEHYPFFEVAAKYYQNSEFKNTINLYNEDFVNGIKRFDNVFMNDVGFVFLDGGDETSEGVTKLPEFMYPEHSENLASFLYINARVKIGTHFLLHDWTIEMGRGSFIKEYLMKNKMMDQFEILNIIDETTGLAHLKKIK